MDCAIVIVTYNRKTLLDECIKRILYQTVPVTRIIIVNNASTDGTYEYLKRYDNDSRFCIVNEKENNGGAFGFYDALKAAKNYTWDWIVILDDDAMLEPDYIEKIYYSMKLYPDCMAFSGTVYTNGSIILEHHARNSFSKIYKPIPVQLAEYERESFEYDYASFCGLMIKRELFNRIGLPLKELFIRNDDYEYSLRIRRFSRICNINEASLNHKTAIPARQKDFSWKLFYSMRNAIYLSEKYFGKFAKYEICFRYILGMIVNGLRFGLTGRQSLKKICVVYIDAIRAGIKNELGINRKYSFGVKQG